MPHLPASTSRLHVLGEGKEAQSKQYNVGPSSFVTYCAIMLLPQLLLRSPTLTQHRNRINNLEELKTRLHHIEQTVSQLKAASRDVQFGTPAQGQAVPETLVTDHEVDGMNIDDCADPSPQGSNNLMNGENHECSSLASLLRDVYLALESNLDSQASLTLDDGPDKTTTRQCLATMESISKSLLADDAWDLSGGSLPPKLPPKGLLDASLDSYFRQVNPMLPIFDEDSFYDDIHKIYEAGSDQADRAWIMCFNNIILQILDAKTAFSFTKKPPNKTSSPLSADVEIEILTPFLTNLRRAVGRLDYFHKPSLVSVQALMSMVTWPFLPINLTEIKHENIHSRYMMPL